MEQRKDLYFKLQYMLTPEEKAKLVGYLISGMKKKDQLWFASEFMNYGMTWDDQPEGWHYWNDIYEKFRRLSEEAR